MFGEHPHRIETKPHQHQAVIDGAGQCGPRNPHFREAPVTENQDPVGERVAQRADDGHPQHDAGAFLRGHVALEHHDQQRRQQPETRNPQVGLGQFGEDGFLTQQQQDPARPPRQRKQQDREGNRQPQAHAGHPADLHRIPRARSRSNQRHDREGKAARQHEQHEEETRRQHPGGQHLDVVPAQHNGVGQPDRCLRQVTTDQGKAEKQHRPRVLPVTHHTL